MAYLVAAVVIGVGSAALLRCSNARESDSGSAAGTSASDASFERSPRGATARFTYNHGKVAQRDLEASDGRYNPIAYIKEDDLLPKEVFEREPRDPRFAPVFERRIENGYTDAFRSLGIDQLVKNVKSECKTLSCYTEVEVSKTDANAVYDRINGLAIGDMSSPGQTDGESQDTALITFYTVYAPEMRDDRAFNDFMQKVFAQVIGIHKAEYEMTHRD